MTLRFTISGPPVGKQRARSSKGRHYTPEKTRRYEHNVGWIGLAAKPARWDMDAWYYLDLGMYFKSKRRPDTDNVVKAIMDGLTGILWTNDQNVLPRVQRVAVGDSRPRVEVEISPYTPEEGK